MLKGMTARQLNETLAYATIEPFGEQRAELRHGQLMHLLDRSNFKRDEPLSPVDFMNYIDRPEEAELTPQEMAQRIDSEVFGI